MQRNLCSRLLLAGSALWCLTIVAAPVLSWSAVYAFFAAICHQDPLRSWRLMETPLPVCIRCLSIYLGFLLSMIMTKQPNRKILAFSIATTLAELAAAQWILDSAWLRAITGMALGAAAGPFVPRGVEEMVPIAARFYRSRVEGSAA